LIGSYNAYNITGAVIMALRLGISPEHISRALFTFAGTPGRLERYILPNGALCIIDLANNPAAFKALLPTLKQMTDHLVVVFGCGGDRDPARRPIMGEIAAAYADHVIVTTDNPRSEKVEDIIAQIMSGIPEKSRTHVSIEHDREKAIHQACGMSTSKTIIALLGKGAEQYQLARGIKTHFSEREIVQAIK
jgi:UDP-N-acetylmuramoyl-L-alanyl-D-glutamate--2,6-diaminopimelate ligase